MHGQAGFRPGQLPADEAVCRHAVRAGHGAAAVHLHQHAECLWPGAGEDVPTHHGRRRSPAEHGLRAEQAQGGALLAGVVRISLRHLPPYGGLRAAREGLFPDGEVHQAACGLCRGIPQAGPDVCLREGHCAGGLPRHRETGVPEGLFPGRRAGVQEPRFLRPDQKRAGQSVCYSAGMPVNCIENRIFAR